MTSFEEWWVTAWQEEDDPREHVEEADEVAVDLAQEVVRGARQWDERSDLDVHERTCNVVYIDRGFKLHSTLSTRTYHT